MEDELLALETRRRIFEAARTAPGSGAREIQRAAGTAWGETVYHLERLTEAGLLHRERTEHQDHYFAATVPLGDRNLLRLSRSRSARRVLVTLLETPSLTVPDLSQRTGLSAGRLSVHLRRMLETGIARAGRQGRYRTFEIVDRDRVARVLITYRRGLADAWIDGALDTWAELFRP